MLKILGKGPAIYFTSGWDLFDFVVTFTSVIGLLGEFFNDTFYFIIVLRPFKLLRLFKVKVSLKNSPNKPITDVCLYEWVYVIVAVSQKLE